MRENQEHLMSILRHKLGDAGNYIKTVRNVGYFMDDEAH